MYAEKQKLLSGYSEEYRNALGTHNLCEEFSPTRIEMTKRDLTCESSNGLCQLNLLLLMISLMQEEVNVCHSEGKLMHEEKTKLSYRHVCEICHSTEILRNIYSYQIF